MTNQIHLPLSTMQKIASLIIFSDPKATAPVMAGVNLKVESDHITALATDRYAIGHYEMSGNRGMAADIGSEIFWLSPTTCKALLAIKRGKRDIDACLVTYGNETFSIDYQGITYQAVKLLSTEDKFEQILSYVDKPLADSFSSFSLNPSHLAKLGKISKNNWHFDRYEAGTTNQKLSPIKASCDDFTVVIQPTIER